MVKKAAASSLELAPMVPDDSDDEDYNDFTAKDEFQEEDEMERDIDRYGKNPKMAKNTLRDTRNSTSIFRKGIALGSIIGAICVAVTSIDFKFSSIRGWFHAAPSHEAFELIETKPIKEYNAMLHVYRHRKTQAEFASFIFKDEAEADREDKAFGASFRTVPTDSKGVAHILEHSVLNGSHKYPVKDPFLHLKKGSLNTFLNAMTYNDRTVYPVASRNSADFSNLIQVYMDAVFYPVCVQTKFKWILDQEGWRYDILKSDDGDQDKDQWQYKGVVYSEMKGVYSNPLSVLEREATSALFPDNTYHFDSGGNPQDIPSLSYQEFTSFYHKHYHPSNVQIYVSGTKDDVMASMTLIDDVLKPFNRKDDIRSKTAIPYQKKTFTTPEYKRVEFAATSKEKNKLEAEKGQGLVSISWLLNDEEMDTYTDLAFNILHNLLLGNDSSPLKKNLDESNLGDSVIAEGYESYLLQATFSVGMKDVSAHAQRDVNKVVIDTLTGLATNGFESDDITAAVNTLEFELREFDTGSYPKAVGVFLTILQKWNYDLDPYSALQYEKPLKQLKKDIKEKGSMIFQNLIQTYLLDNNHRVVLELLPSETFEEEQLKEEKDRLSEIKKSFSDDELAELENKAEKLIALQEAPDALHDIQKIPHLRIEDIPQKVEKYPIQVTENAYDTGVTVLKHEVSSSHGILYANFGIDISNVSYDDIELLPIICNLMERGTKALTEVEFHRAVGVNTGGISVKLEFQPVLPKKFDSSYVTSGNNFKTLLFVKGKSTVNNVSNLFELFSKILYDADLNKKEKVAILFNEELSLLKISVPSHGHLYTNMRIKGRYSPLSFIQEKLYGIASFDKLESLQKQLDDDWDALLARMENVLQTILSTQADGMVVNLTGDKNGLKSVEKYAKEFVTSQLQTSKENQLTVQNFREVDHPWASRAREEMDIHGIKDETVIVSTQVSYNGKGGLMWKEGEKVPGSAQVVKGFLENGYLWDTIRVKNGAYGAMSSLSISSGLFVMLSYRDPNLDKTMKAFDAASSALFDQTKSGDLTSSEINTAIIGSIGSLDGPAMSPEKIGWASYIEYLTGRGDEYRQKWRYGILRTKKKDFVDFATRLSSWKHPSFASISSQQAVAEYKNETFIKFEIVNLT